MNTAIQTWPVLSWLWLVEGIAFYALLQWSLAQKVPGVRAFRGLVFGSMLFVTAEALNLTLPAGTLRYWSSGVSFFGIGIILPNLAVLFADITGKNRWFTPVRRKVLYSLGVLIGLTKLTDPWWGLVYRSEEIVHEHGFYVSQYTQGLVHYFLMAGLIAAMLLGLTNIALAWRDSTQLMRRHLVALALSCLIPVGSAVLFNSGFQPWGSLELTPFALFATAGLTTWAIFHDRLVEVVPIARNMLVDQFHEGVLVVDAAGVVVDANPALRRMLALGDGEILGQPVGAVVKAWPALVELCARDKSGQIELQPAIGGDICWDASWRPLRAENDGKNLGFLLVLTDVSARKRTESHLHDLVAERTKEWRDATRNLLHAADEEKRKLGQSLQETFAQELDQLQKDATALTTLAHGGGDPAALAEKLNQLTRHISATSQSIRDFISLLEGPDLAHRDFKEALSTTLEHLQATLGVQCTLDLAGDFPLPSRERSRHLIEVVREIVLSSVQAGKARAAKIVFRNNPEGQTVTVSDDGQPRTEKELAGDVFGLSRLRLRANLLNGRLTVRTGLTSGTTVELFTPPPRSTDTTPGFFPA